LCNQTYWKGGGVRLCEKSRKKAITKSPWRGDLHRLQQISKKRQKRREELGDGFAKVVVLSFANGYHTWQRTTQGNQQKIGQGGAQNPSSRLGTWGNGDTDLQRNDIKSIDPCASRLGINGDGKKPRIGEVGGGGVLGQTQKTGQMKKNKESHE